MPEPLTAARPAPPIAPVSGRKSSTLPAVSETPRISRVWWASPTFVDTAAASRSASASTFARPVMNARVSAARRNSVPASPMFASTPMEAVPAMGA